MLPIAAVDLRVQKVPNKLLLVALAIRVLIYIAEFIVSVPAAVNTLKDNLLGAIIIGAFFLLLLLVFKNSIGMGDIKLFAVMGLYQGLWGAINSVFFSLMVSGNVYDSYEKDEFTVDMTAPVVNVTYDNNSAKNSNQFKADRTATIQIVEHNFDATKVVAKVMASGTEAISYAEYLAKPDSWTKVEGKADTWQAVIEYTDEAHYTFEISCTDKAGNINSSVDYTGQVAPTAFTLDKSVPTEMDIKIGEKSILGSMDTHAFDTFYGKTVVVKLSANCDISGLESFKYQKVADVSEYAENGAWTDYNAETGITVEPSEKFVIYFRAEDRAGNVKIVRSTGVVVDNQKPVGETNAPEIDILPEEPNANGIHKDDVSVDLNYYKAYRTATVVITEHNFNAERVTITNTATDDGLETTKPTVSGWTTNGDKHTATISYSKDAKYTFDIAMNDKAGNASAEYTEETFFVDATMPSLEITGVADNSANNGDVIPVVTYSDTNYDADKVTITLTGANRKTVELDGAYADIHNGRTFTFKNFAEEKEIDDIYTLTATITDKAGNTTEKTINFSVNRFGSTYAVSEAAEKLNGTYVQKPIDVVVTETNTNELKNIKITLFKNNETIVLTEGTDYKIDVNGGNGNWYHYTYTVFAKNFADDGVYRLTFHSEDAAGNVAENTLDTKDTEISFGVDATKPNIVVANLENGVTYALENMTVNMSISDNLLLSSITVYLDDYNTPYKTWTTEEIESIIAENGEFTFDIAGDSTSAHKVKIVSVDAAGNEQVKEITDFFVTTNIWVRYYNNKGLFFGSIGGVILLAGLIVFLVVWKKKKISK